MIELIMAKLGFSGMISVALAATLVGGSLYTKLAITRRDAKIAKLTDQVRDVAQQRDALLNSNRQLNEAVKQQNAAIDGWKQFGEAQKAKAERATKDSQSVKEQWEAYISQSDAQLAKDGDLAAAYERVTLKWGSKKPGE